MARGESHGSAWGARADLSGNHPTGQDSPLRNQTAMNRTPVSRPSVIGWLLSSHRLVHRRVIFDLDAEYTRMAYLFPLSKSY